MPSEEMTRPIRRFLVVLIGIGLAGTIGFMTLEGWNVLDALYMTVITLSTVGFGEIHPISAAGKIFIIVLITAGVGAVAYLFSTLSQYVVSGALTGSFRSRRMQRIIDALSGHFIVCGYGRVGQHVVSDLEDRGRRCVVIESDSTTAERLADRLVVIGDAADDDALRRAGINRARGLVAATGDDADNLFITLSARSLNPNTLIVARANDPASEPKLLRAGATHVISPFSISGHRIASQLLNPSITDFLDVVMHSADLELWLEEVTVTAGSDLEGKAMETAMLRLEVGANIIAIRRAQERGFTTVPQTGLQVQSGDVMIALGTQEQLHALSKLAGHDPTIPRPQTAKREAEREQSEGVPSSS